MSRIRVLVVDDSSLIREIIIKILEKDPEFFVVGQAENGSEAVRLTQNLRPDLIIMDLYMPVMDGFQAIEKIMAYHPTPILVATTALAREGKIISFRALELGALEVIDKPTLSSGPDLSPKENEFLLLAKMLSRVQVVSHVRGKLKRIPSEPPAAENRDADQFKIVAVAASTGGPKALLHILRGLPENLPAAIVVVQHISEGFSSGLASWLNHEAQLIVKEGVKGEELKPGTMYIAPTGFHMLVNSSRRIVFNSDRPIMSHRPSGTTLLKSVAEYFGPKALGVILSGMGSDGAEGILEIKKRGGKTIAQAENDCVVFGMPKAAIELGAVDKVLPLDLIAAEIQKMLSEI